MGEPNHRIQSASRLLLVTQKWRPVAFAASFPAELKRLMPPSTHAPFQHVAGFR
ncbi:hypothetical protein SynMEDNS5_02586 [Synechococcus sp. MEDNS5]|nr:hypothetical protein SynMEDNS5_02586 [Synechococcus sp. MEDNS5]